jgi:hypothetical protein
MCEATPARERTRKDFSKKWLGRGAGVSADFRDSKAVYRLLGNRAPISEINQSNSVARIPETLYPIKAKSVRDLLGSSQPQTRYGN